MAPDTIATLKLQAAVELSSIRLFITTKSVSGTNSKAELHWSTDVQGNPQYHASPMVLERRAGKTDLFEQPFLPPVSKASLRDWRNHPIFKLVVKGVDVWDIDHYVLLGKFEAFSMQLDAPHLDSGPHSSWVHTDMGWRMMAIRDDDLVADPTVGIGGFIHSIPHNGTF